MCVISPMARPTLLVYLSAPVKREIIKPVTAALRSAAYRHGGWPFANRKRRHAFLGRLLPRRSAITGFERDDNLVFEESEPRFSKIIGLSEFSQKALKLNVFAITDVLIYGENSSFENLHLDISFSKGMEKGSAEFLRFGKVIVKNAEVDIIGPWR